MKTVQSCVVCDMPFVSDMGESGYCTMDCWAHAKGVRLNPRRYGGKSSPEVVKIRLRARSAELRSIKADYKKRFGCKDCGYNEHHVALQFDHISGDKKFNVSTAGSLRAFYEEAKKCEVVCANCHMIRTYARLHIAKGFTDVFE